MECNPRISTLELPNYFKEIIKPYLENFYKNKIDMNGINKIIKKYEINNCIFNINLTRFKFFLNYLWYIVYIIFIIYILYILFRFQLYPI